MIDANGRGSFADDAVTLTLNGDTVKIAESYEFTSSILSQPSHFSVRLGYGGIAAQLVANYPPGTPCSLSIAGAPHATGFLDGFSLSASAGATEVTFMGRDGLGPLASAHIDVEQSFSNITYADLAGVALTACGLDKSKLVFSGIDDRTARTKITQTDLVPIRTAKGKFVSGGGTTTVSTCQTKIGETWLEFTRRHFDRVGLFMWAGAKGSYILSEPSKDADPSYRLLRRRGTENNAVNVTHAEWTNDTSSRHTTVTIYARTGQQKFARAKAKGASVDDEMFNLSPLFANRGLTIRDRHVANTDQGQFLARRKLAEERRQGWQLHYTVAGHTVPSLQGGAPAVWTPNTTVQVEDDEFGLHGVYWIESCVYRRSPQTETILRLMRLSDLIFATDTED